MSVNRILAFSSSRSGSGGFLETAIPAIRELLGDKESTIAFIPFASVGNEYEKYTAAVKKALSHLPYSITTVMPANAKEVIEKATVLMTGGGNTFKLLHDIYDQNLLDVIRDKVNNGAPYIGWSAGANITGPTIGTTNDMPVIAPKSFNALGLFPFQINPHYTNITMEGHNGETRDQRLEEFIQLNPGVPVVALPEGTALKLENGVLTFLGQAQGVLFSATSEEATVDRKVISINEDLSFLL